MRLSVFEVNSIKKVFESVFGPGKVYLFGSRVDDSQTGGDIDLYIKPEHQDDLANKKVTFLAQLKLLIGEQKIDVIITRDPSRPIEVEAISNGVLL